VRFLCIDLGDKRTGIAVGDDALAMAVPAEVLEVPIHHNGGAALLAAIEAVVAAHAPHTLVVGLPLNMDGTEGPRAKAVRAFAARVAAATRLDLRFHDERLSTAQADWTMARSGLTHAQKKAKRDALAAAAILTDFLSRPDRTPPTPHP
jgi:putative Holliday junction resolvase